MRRRHRLRPTEREVIAKRATSVLTSEMTFMVRHVALCSELGSAHGKRARRAWARLRRLRLGDMNKLREVCVGLAGKLWRRRIAP